MATLDQDKCIGQLPHPLYAPGKLRHSYEQREGSPLSDMAQQVDALAVLFRACLSGCRLSQRCVPGPT